VHVKLTLETLRAVMPNLWVSRGKRYLPLLNDAMAEADINTPLRVAAFLATLAHESGEFLYFEELASGQAYENRIDLGNVRPGDGRRYKGRGPIQVTGRHNYRQAGLALDLPLEDRPWLAAIPEVGFRVAAWYWKDRGLNQLADAGNFESVTRRVNGGLRGWEQRLAYYHRALAVFGVLPTT
jgi:predicted chitinase